MAERLLLSSMKNSSLGSKQQVILRSQATKSIQQHGFCPLYRTKPARIRQMATFVLTTQRSTISLTILTRLQNCASLPTILILVQIIKCTASALTITIKQWKWHIQRQILLTNRYRNSRKMQTSSFRSGSTKKAMMALPMTSI